MQIFVGIVLEGSKRASALGYPTVNIPLTRELDSGIYAGRATTDKKEYMVAVFVDPKRNILEAHLLDFSGDLYGKEISVEVCEKIRETESFADEASLARAIKADVERVRAYFKNR